MSEPERIQRKRSKGWRMPEGAVYVGRPTKWGTHTRSQSLGGMKQSESFLCCVMKVKSQTLKNCVEKIWFVGARSIGRATPMCCLKSPIGPHPPGCNNWYANLLSNRVQADPKDNVMQTAVNFTIHTGLCPLGNSFHSLPSRRRPAVFFPILTRLTCSPHCLKKNGIPASIH
jgi:hypothetical protein